MQINFNTLIVGLWCDMLGGVQWWEDPLPRNPPPGALTTTGDWIQDGEASQHCLQ